MREVPNGWRRVALREITEEQVAKVGGRRKITVLSSTKHHGLVPSDEYFKGRTIYSSDLSGYKVAQRDWFAYATNHLAEGSIGLQKDFDLACVSPIYTVFSCREGVHPPYMFRVLKSPEVLAKYAVHEQASVDRRGAVRYRDFGKIEINLPPMREQQRIVAILDTLDLATASIRSSSAKFSQLRAAHIRELMNDGLSILRSAEASELSRIEGRRCGDWTVTSLAGILKTIEAGNSPNVEDTPAGPGEWGVLKVSAVGRHGFRPEENKVARDRSLHIGDLCVQSGDLLISRANTSELVGLTCIVRDTPPGLMLCDKTLRLHIDPARTSAEYIHLALSLAEVRRQIETAATGTSNSMKNISQTAIRGLVIPWADRTLMDRVVRDDAAYAAQIEVLVRQEQGLIRLKTGLMEDLLTGRVRVSEAEAVLEDL
ncbi:restriction endonuclease subunit S [Planomonospora algeriensis]